MAAPYAGWIPRPAPFNASKHGSRVKFSEQRSVAERERPEGYWKDAVVCTAQPVPVGEVWRVTVLSTTDCWLMGGGLGLGLTTELPEHVPEDLLARGAGPHEWICWGNSIYHNKKRCAIPDLPSLCGLSPGQSVGLLVTANGQLHIFLNGEHRCEIATGLPVDIPLWGTADVYISCTKIKSEMMSAPRGQQVVEQLQRQLKEKETEVEKKSAELLQRVREIQQKEQQLSRVRAGSCQLRQRLDTAHTELQQKNAIIHQKDTELQQNRTTIQNTILQQEVELQQRSSMIRGLQAQLQQKHTELQAELRQKDAMIQQLQEKDAELAVMHSYGSPQVAPQEIEFWQVSRQELQVREDKVLGGGAWGFVCEGHFRGQRVAIKCVYPNILAPHTRDRIRREISTMAQVRHPNLVLFIAAVLEDRSGPKIITEILDTSLRSAYEEDRLGSNKPRIFRDVAAAMNYLHSQREPIIHRDLSTANVLLEAMAGEVWKAKVSDFGSANLVRLATTPGEGAIVYTAPEAFPQPPQSPTPRPAQTTKIDVYSYGVLLCEVILAQFPDLDSFKAMVEQVSGVWPAMHRLITNCIKWSPEERPSMADILRQLDRMSR